MSEPALALRVNGAERSIRATDLVGLLEELGLDPGASGLAVALNDEVVPRTRWRAQRLEDGDRVEVVGAVQGG